MRLENNSDTNASYRDGEHYHVVSTLHDGVCVFAADHLTVLCVRNAKNNTPARLDRPANRCAFAVARKQYHAAVAAAAATATKETSKQPTDQRLPLHVRGTAAVALGWRTR